MAATHYHSSSKGPVEIATMRFEHAQNAHAKLSREGGDPDVIDALAQHIAAIESTFGEKVDG
jgi:hypothetical protein